MGPTCDALSLILIPGKDAAPARGAAAPACCWRSDRFRMSLIIILSISLALTVDGLGVG
jgi:hypothetical protein